MNKLYMISSSNLCEFPVGEFFDRFITPWDIDHDQTIAATKTNGNISIKVALTAPMGDAIYGNNYQYTGLVDRLKTDKIKSFLKMTNDFKIFINIAIYDKNRTIIEEGIRIHTIDAKDVIFLNGISENSDMNYVKGKRYILSIPLPIKKRCSGIVTGVTKSPRYIHIKGIEIMGVPMSDQSTEIIKKLNQTLLDTTLPPNSATVSDITEKLIPVYSSYKCGQKFNLINIVSDPTSIDLNFDVLIPGFVESFDNTTLEDIIRENIKNDEGGEGPDPGPGPDDPDFGGTYFAQYERCDPDYPNAGIVVRDDEYATTIQKQMCYKFSEVIKDIPDITLGEYVSYVESMVMRLPL